MRKALVTGATGFVGRNLSSHLVKSGWQVTAVHRDSSATTTIHELRAAGVTTVPFSDHAQLRLAVREAAPEVVFHLAAHQARDHEESELDEFIDANIALGTHVLEAIVGTGCVFVNAASYFQYRDSEPAAFTMYSATKQAFIEIAGFYREKRSVDVRDVVLFDNFGPGDVRSKLINQLLAAATDNLPVALGPGAQAINALFIEDLAAGLVASAEPGNPQMMTVRAADNATVAEIVAELEAVIGRPLDKTFDESRRPHDMVESAGSWPTPAGWSPAHSLADGLEATYRAFSAN